jgi:ABC transporter substrate binding protein
MSTRRAFIKLLGGAAAWPLAARAQQGERMRRMGVLTGVGEDDLDTQARHAALLQGLAQLGWTDGHNLQIDFRWGRGDEERIRKSATELAALAPDVVFATGSAGVGAMLRVTRTVPIVFAIVPDPVGSGFVNSLSRPGGNATGFLHGRDRQLDALARILLALPVERLVVGVFLDQHHRQQARAGKAPGDRMEGSRRLRDRLARPAAELLPHMLGHEPLPRHHIERLGDILPDLRELAAAAARARSGRGVDDAPARQIGGKVAPRRLAPREALDLDARRLRLRLVLSRVRGQLLELQFHLVDQPLAALGAQAEHLALHLGDHQLQVLDQRLRAHELGARLDQRRLQRSGVVGKMIGCGRHGATESQSRAIRRLHSLG